MNDLAPLTRPGRHALPWIDGGHPDRPITLHCYRPEAHAPARPVVIVQHGMLRNGDDYRDFWIPAADKHGLLIVAPTFANDPFPKAEHYNNGMVRDDTGALRPREAWTYNVPGRVFAALLAAGLTTRAKAHVYGHSAGGQFVHRMLATVGADFAETMVAGNPGWYTLPTLDKAFPEGLGGIGLGEAELARMLAFPLIILAGDRDIVTDEPSLPKNPEAIAQGPHRFARAHNFFAVGQAEAALRSLPFGWRLEPVAGVGHDGRTMSAVSAAIWFEGRRPSAAEIEKLVGERVA